MIQEKCFLRKVLSGHYLMGRDNRFLEAIRQDLYRRRACCKFFPKDPYNLMRGTFDSFFLNGL